MTSASSIKNLSTFVLLSLMIFLVGPSPSVSQARALELAGRVTRVIDGDTIVVKIRGKEEKVRLLGIDAPELGKHGAPPEFMAGEAKSFLEKLVLGKKVILKFDLEREDGYGRLLCYVYTRDGVSANESLLRRGLALVIRGFSFKMKKKYERIQEEARKGEKGIFSRSGRTSAKYSVENFYPVEIYPGPSRTFTVRWKNLALPLVHTEKLEVEVSRIRKYLRIYPPDKVEKALIYEGYMPLGDNGARQRGKTRDSIVKGRQPGEEIPTISYKEALQHVGQEVVVTGKIVRTKKTSKVIFLDFDEDWKHNLSLVIFRRNLPNFPYRPEIHLKGKTVAVRGRVNLYKGSPEMIISSPSQIEIMER